MHCAENRPHSRNKRNQRVIGSMGTKLKIDLSALCTRRVEREGQELRSSNALRNPLERKQSDGSILFTA